MYRCDVLHQHRIVPFANDEFGRTAPDIDHQALVRRRRQRMRGADVDQTRLFAPADDLDGKAENRLGTLDELGGILGYAQGIGRHGAYRAGREPTQTLGKSPQRFQSTLLRLLIEPLVAGEPGRQTDRFFQGTQ